jgi:signal transduction histidine kinase
VLIGVAFTGIYSHERAMQALVEQRDRALATVSANRISDLLHKRASALKVLAAEQAFHHRDAEAQRVLLGQAGDLDGLFAGAVALLDETGNPLPQGMSSATSTPDEHVLELVRTVMARQDTAFSPLFAASQRNDTLLMGVPVYDKTGTTYGVLAALVSVDGLELESILGQVQVGQHGAAYLVGGDGQILARAPLEQARTSLAGHTGLDAALQDVQPGATLCRAPDGERMTLAYAPVDYGGLRWRVLIEEPWREVIGPVLRYSQFVPLVAALAVVVSLLTLYYGVRAIVRPLQTLGERAERVAWGDFEATGAPVGGVEEIEDLRRTLDQMARRIQNYQRGMHDYIAAITQAQEEERKRLARELHDDTAQALIALGQQVEMSQKLLSKDPERAAQKLAEVRTLLAQTGESVRRFSRDLRPIYLEDLGFIPALEMLARSESPDLKIHFSAFGPMRRLAPNLELTAYRIVQEALNNVIQHAGARHAWVEVHFEAKDLIVSVRDDGQGFEAPDLPDALARQGHFGLMGIQERALLHGGNLTIHSTPGEGTEIMVHLPYVPPK